LDSEGGGRRRGHRCRGGGGGGGVGLGGQRRGPVTRRRRGRTGRGRAEKPTCADSAGGGGGRVLQGIDWQEGPGPRAGQPPGAVRPSGGGCRSATVAAAAATAAPCRRPASPVKTRWQPETRRRLGLPGIPRHSMTETHCRAEPTSCSISESLGPATQNTCDGDASSHSAREKIVKMGTVELRSCADR
jgi:hypothetical protein